MGKAARARRRESRVLRDVGVVYVVGDDGQEVEVVGDEAEVLRMLMAEQCPICSQLGSECAPGEEWPG